MKNLTKRLAILLSVFCMFMACNKELSLENGGFAGTAQGELVDSLGNCKNVTIRGSYMVDTALTNNNYVLVNVNFTATGKYKIFTDTVNGMWFLDSGFAISVGPSVVKIKGKGTPILGKKTDFFLIFNNIVGKGFCISQISFFQFILHFLQEFFVHLREIIDKVERVLNLMSNTCGEFAQ